MIRSESGIRFEFDDKYTVIKYDDTDFHKQSFNSLPGSKAVDFLLGNKSSLIFIEVKNCKGAEADNRWRIEPDNRKRSTISTDHDVADRDSLDIEIPQKVAMTIAALVGAYSRPTPWKFSDECKPISEKMCCEDIYTGERRVYIVLVLEGSFGSYSKTDRMIRNAIAEKMKKKLKWMRCTIQVVCAAEIEKILPGVKAGLEG